MMGRLSKGLLRGSSRRTASTPRQPEIGRTTSSGHLDFDVSGRLPTVRTARKDGRKNSKGPGPLLSPIHVEPPAFAVKPDEVALLLNEGVRALRCVFTGGSQIREEDVRAIVAKLRGSGCKLESLDFKNVHMGPEIAQMLVKGLKENITVVYLSLERNNLGRVGAQAIADLLDSRSSRLRELNLSRNHFGDDGCKALAKALKNNRSLTKLDISACEISAEGGHALAEMLQVNRGLRQLDLSGNKLEEGGLAIAETLTLSNVRSIDTSHNNLPLDIMMRMEAAQLLPPEMWRSPRFEDVARATCKWSPCAQLAASHGARSGEAIRSFLEAAAFFWERHTQGSSDQSALADFLASLHAPFALEDKQGAQHCPRLDGLQQLASMYLPQDKVGLLRLPPPEAMHADEPLVLNLTPFDATFGKSTVASRSCESISALKVKGSGGHREHRTSSKGTAAFPPLPGFVPSATSIPPLQRTLSKDTPSRRKHGRSSTVEANPNVLAQGLNVEVHLSTQAELERPWLPMVDQLLQIGQGVGERRYGLVAKNDSDTDAGELRIMYSVRFSHGTMAALITLVWSPPARFRGVPLRDLKKYWEKQKALHRQSRMKLSSSPIMYDAVEHAIKPTSAATQSSLAELLDFGPVETFISHSWAYEVDFLIKCAGKHCEHQSSGLNTRVWVCSVAINQRRVPEELGSDITNSPFAQALKSETCQAMALVLDDGCGVLRRIWVLYEIMTVIRLRETGRQIGFDLCTTQGVLNKGELHEAALDIGEQISNIDVALAKASNPEDKKKIDRAIALELGGYQEMNKKLRMAVDDSLMQTQKTYYRKVAAVREKLGTSDLTVDVEALLAEIDELKVTNSTLRKENQSLKNRLETSNTSKLSRENMQLRRTIDKLRGGRPLPGTS